MKTLLRPQPSLPEMPVQTKHPARYSNPLFPIFMQYLRAGDCLLDACAGSGKIGKLKRYGFKGIIVCNELEPEWATGQGVDYWHFGDAACMAWANDGDFDIEILSPVYGNRMSDTYVDGGKRYTYTNGLGRALSPENTGALQWGEAYRIKHQAIYKECVRVLRAGGLFLLNVSDHYRDGKVIQVSDWHRETLIGLGLRLLETHEVKTARVRNGKNHELRVPFENVFVLSKG